MLSKFAISNIAWKPENRLNIYKLLHNEGISNLEIAPGLFVPDTNKPYEVSSENLQQKKAETETYGLSLVSMQSLHFGASGLSMFENKISRQAMLDYSKQAVDFASKLGIGNLVFGSPKNRVIPKEMSQNEAHKIAIQFFTQLGDYAQFKNTYIGLEANASAYGCNFLSKTTAAVEFIKQLNNDGVKLNFDLGTFILENEDTKLLTEILQVSNHVHISVPYLKAIYDFDATIHDELKKALLTSNYNKYISIEMRGEDNVLEHVTKALKFLKLHYSN